MILYKRGNEDTLVAFASQSRLTITLSCSVILGEDWGVLNGTGPIISWLPDHWGTL